MLIRRLEPVIDRELIIEALSWVNDGPRWARDADRAWGEISDDAYLEMMKTDAQADIGVFEKNKLVTMITIARVSRGVFNSHLLVKRGTNPQTVIEGANALKHSMWKDLNATEIWAWLAAQNKGAQRIVREIGFEYDGIRMWHGKTHGRLIEWRKFICRREAKVLEQAA